jgi:hypothetical protein
MEELPLCVRQADAYQDEKGNEEDTACPVVDLDDFLCFFLIHFGRSTKGMVMVCVDGAKIREGCYSGVSDLIKGCCNSMPKLR